ncbi:pyridine nucleotide-disulfide oxidoreductase-like protein [Purpureocillium lavendulum]|uniref:Pyridine nucleotide-disulfide oxidoreductase-like protein n=1 Tax=Purpureocillium lavendulum TaxID=1247861 RepID=A0AB34FVS3_9HYPO|nr:pyridine nucleotide-disulfide oxidoreductase-like protein [Purpureocillium lavendulum]
MAASALATSLLTVCPVVGDLPTLFGSENTTTHPTPSARQMALLRSGVRAQRQDSSGSSSSSSSCRSTASGDSRRESVDSAAASCCSASCTECDAGAAVREMAVCVEEAAEDEDASVLLLAQGSAQLTCTDTSFDAPGDGFLMFDTNMRQIQTCAAQVVACLHGTR